MKIYVGGSGKYCSVWTHYTFKRPLELSSARVSPLLQVHSSTTSSSVWTFMDSSSVVPFVEVFVGNTLGNGLSINITVFFCGFALSE